MTLFGPLKQIFPKLNNFYKFVNLWNKLSETLYILGVWSKSIPINSEKLLTELNGPHCTELG
jgi:hypothetical protein